MLCTIFNQPSRWDYTVVRFGRKVGHITDWPEMGQIRGFFFSDQIQYILALTNFGRKSDTRDTRRR